MKLWAFAFLLCVTFTCPVALAKKSKQPKVTNFRETGDDSCPREFNHRCRCGVTTYLNEPRYVVNCTNSGFNESAVLERLPPETQVLIFTGNYIPVMPWNIFGKMNDYPFLEVIDMTNNQIREIKGKTYHHVDKVKTLILNHNDLDITGDKNHPRIFSNFINLESLHLTNAFTEAIDSRDYMENLQLIFNGSSLKTLQKLHLEQNELWSFSNPDIFCELPNLMDLYIGDNNLSDININLGCLPKLRYVDLEYNHVRTLQNRTLIYLEEHPNYGPGLRINLLGNPFLCDCNIADLLVWLKSSKLDIAYKDNYSCMDGFPRDNAGKFLSQVREIQCFTSAPRQDHQATTVVLGILTVILITLLVIVAYMNADALRSRGREIWDQVARRGQYMSILSKPEEQEVHV